MTDAGSPATASASPTITGEGGGPRTATLADIEARERRDRVARRDALVASLTDIARGRAWRYVLFGSLAREDHQRRSDADILIAPREGRLPEDWLDAWLAAERACAILGFEPDIRLLSDLPPDLRETVLREGIHCG